MRNTLVECCEVRIFSTDVLHRGFRRRPLKLLWLWGNIESGGRVRRKSSKPLLVFAGVRNIRVFLPEGSFWVSGPCPFSILGVPATRVDYGLRRRIVVGVVDNEV